MNCILCHSNDTHILQEVKQKQLNALYKKVFDINTSHLITSDILYHHCKSCDLRFFNTKEGKIPTGDNDFYNALNSLQWYYFGEKDEYHYAQKYINAQSKVLEVGCGKGAFAHFLPQEAKKHYVGLEFSTGAKEMAAKDGICIENISIEEYAKNHAQYFDVTCSFQVLEHVANPHSFIASQIQCLKNTQIEKDSQLNGGGA